MKKFYCLLLVSFTATVFAQGPTAGVNLSVKQHKIKVPSHARNVGKMEPQLQIEVLNTLSTEIIIDLDVIFVGTFQRGKAPERFIRKRLKYQITLASLEKQVITADSILWFHGYVEPNAKFPSGTDGFSQPEGWIVRAVRGGEVVKVEASGAAMRRLADDPEIMAGLESGGSIPAR